MEYRLQSMYNHMVGRTASVVPPFYSLLPGTTVCSQNINNQNVNKADKTLTDYRFLSRYHYTISNQKII